MKLTLKQRTVCGLIINIFIVAVTTIIMIKYATSYDSQGPLGEFSDGLGAFRTFTNLSNIFCALIALAISIASIYNLSNKKYYQPHSLRVFQLLATTMVVLTFIVVLVFLNPLRISQTGNLFDLFSGKMFFTHFLTPLLATITFVFFTPSRAKLTTIDNLLALVPNTIYGIVYFINVIALKNWPDFYNFTFGGQTQFIPLVFVAILAVTFAIAKLLIKFSARR